MSLAELQWTIARTRNPGKEIELWNTPKLCETLWKEYLFPHMFLLALVHGAKFDDVIAEKYPNMIAQLRRVLPTDEKENGELKIYRRLAKAMTESGWTPTEFETLNSKQIELIRYISRNLKRLLSMADSYLQFKGKVWFMTAGKAIVSMYFSQSGSPTFNLFDETLLLNSTFELMGEAFQKGRSEKMILTLTYYLTKSFKNRLPNLKYIQMDEVLISKVGSKSTEYILHCSTTNRLYTADGILNISSRFSGSGLNIYFNMQNTEKYFHVNIALTSTTIGGVCDMRLNKENAVIEASYGNGDALDITKVIGYNAFLRKLAVIWAQPKKDHPTYIKIDRESFKFSGMYLESRDIIEQRFNKVNYKDYLPKI